MTEAQSRFDVFLCHNSQDTPEVKAIARQLQSRGLSEQKVYGCLLRLSQFWV